MKDEILLGKPLTESDFSENTGSNGSLIVSKGEKPITFSGDGHLITIAPTGAGKGRNAIIPNLLTYPGSIIVLDPKGENFNVTSKARKKMGQRIIRLDPFNWSDESRSDSFNPFDILDFTGSSLSDEVRSMISAILDEHSLLKTDPFWDLAARNLIAGLAIHLASSDDNKKNLSELRSFLYNSDVVYNIAVTLDKNKDINQEAYEEMAIYLQAKDQARQDILMSAQPYFTTFGSPLVKNCITETSFDLNSIVEGDNFSIYITIPPNKLRSHYKLLRVWVGSLISLISSRKVIPQYKTLFLLDEVALLGNLRIIETAITLMRGSGLHIWSFWQDLSQLRKNYPESWESILNNCSAIQLFGARNYRVSQDFSSIVGANISEIQDLASDEQLLMINNEGPLLSKRLDYLSGNKLFSEATPNPYYNR